MITLTAKEARVLGVLVEKAYTTPGQYPMTLNALTSGCNQKSNRDPLTEFDEDDIQDALDHLRSKQFVREVYTSGSRVAKFRQVAKEVLSIDGPALAVLAELLLRGPQTLGELRGRAQRMQPMDTIDVTREAIDRLMDREEPLVRVIAPAPGSRAERYLQLLAPDLHRYHDVTPATAGGGGATHHLTTASSMAAGAGGVAPGVAAVGPAATAPGRSGIAAASSAAATASSAGSGEVARLTARLAEAEREIERLKRAVQRIAASLGEDDPLAD